MGKTKFFVFYYNEEESDLTYEECETEGDMNRVVLDRFMRFRETPERVIRGETINVRVLTTVVCEPEKGDKE